MPEFENIEQFEIKGDKTTIPPIAPHSSGTVEYTPRKRPGQARNDQFGGMLPDPIAVKIVPIQAEDLEREFRKADRESRREAKAAGNTLSAWKKIKIWFRRLRRKLWKPRPVKVVRQNVSEEDPRRQRPRPPRKNNPNDPQRGQRSQQGGQYQQRGGNQQQNQQRPKPQHDNQKQGNQNQQNRPQHNRPQHNRPQQQLPQQQLPQQQPSGQSNADDPAAQQARKKRRRRRKPSGGGAPNTQNGGNNGNNRDSNHPN